MTDKAVVPFDFRSSGATNDSVGVLKNWMRKTAEIFQERLAQISMGAVAIEFHRVLARTFETEIDQIDAKSLGFDIGIGKSNESTLAYLSCLELVAIASCLLGNEPKETPDTRKLTSIETAIGKLIFEALIEALREAWPGEQKMEIVLQQSVDTPHRSRMMPMDSVVLRVEMMIEVAVAKGKIVWLIQRKNVEPVLRTLLGAQGEEKNTDPRGLVESLELEMIATLGEVEMGMQQLSEMSPGDLIYLNQKITNPIDLNTCGGPGFRVWPGRVGSQQCVQIIDLI